MNTRIRKSGPGRQHWWALLLIGAVLLAVPFVAALGGQAWVRIANFAILYVFLALGLNIVVGYAGLLDLGYVAFYAVGAYVYALLASPHFGIHLPFWVILPLGAALACLFGVLLGSPTLKLRGDYLAIVTLGFGEIIRIFLNNLNAPINVTNGAQGITPVSYTHLDVYKSQRYCCAARRAVKPSLARSSTFIRGCWNGQRGCARSTAVVRSPL